MFFDDRLLIKNEILKKVYLEIPGARAEAHEKSIKEAKSIGKTKSGKKIYDYWAHPEHESFSHKDHQDAAYLHMKLSDNYHKKGYEISNHYKNGNKRKNPQLVVSNQQAANAYRYHKAQADVHVRSWFEKTPSIKKSEKPPKATMGPPQSWFHTMKMKVQQDMPHLKETEAIRHVREHWQGLDDKTKQGIHNTHKSDDVKKSEWHELKEHHDSARNKEKGKPIGNNTRVVRDGDDYAVKLHRTNVVTAHKNGDRTLDSGGWKTRTTKDRMNTHLPHGVHVGSHKGEWHVHDKHGNKHKYEDGMRIDHHGTPVKRREKETGHEGLRGLGGLNKGAEMSPRGTSTKQKKPDKPKAKKPVDCSSDKNKASHWACREGKKAKPVKKNALAELQELKKGIMGGSMEKKDEKPPKAQGWKYSEWQSKPATPKQKKLQEIKQWAQEQSEGKAKNLGKEDKDSKRYSAEVRGTPYDPKWTPGGADKKPIGRDPKQMRAQRGVDPGKYPDAPKATQPSMTAQEAVQRVVGRESSQAKKSEPLEILQEFRKSNTPKKPVEVLEDFRKSEQSKNIEHPSHPEHKEVAKKAAKHGYHGLFALVPHDVANEHIDNARKTGDSHGLLMGMMLKQNRNAWDTAMKEHKGKKK